MKKTISLTKEGKAELEKELAELKAGRPAIAEKIATARAFGDLSENEEYSSARAEQKQAENRILEIEDILKSAKIIRSAAHSTATMGATITIELGGEEKTYSIVSPVEADPLSGKISDKSPIGQALLGKKAGDDFTLPNGKTGTIKDIK
ncbi:transcription elongation factor GreA [Candidatus Saccharibacteria bacterium]|nr:transcription elongation factor GreA [Candidatus Saccharibacteria bacterium]